LNIGIAAGAVLLFSLALPWTVVWGTQTVGFLTYTFYIFEFPFMEYTVVYSFQGTESFLETYQFAPRYLGITLIILGGILAIIGSIKQKYSALVEWGGISSILALIFFMCFNSANIIISYPLTQKYTSVPLGIFIPVLFWILILFYPRKTTTLLKEKAKIFCAQCGKEMTLEFSFCPFCGAEATRLVCPICGKEVSIEHNFCPSCGSRMPK